MGIKERAFPPRTRYKERSKTEEMDLYQSFRSQLKRLKWLDQLKLERLKLEDRLELQQSKLEELKVLDQGDQFKTNSIVRHASWLAEPQFCWIDSPTKTDPNVNGLEAFSKSSNRATRLLKTKQGLAGFANDSKIAAMADTGSRKNVMSETCAKRLDLTIEGSPSTFEIGNSKQIQSIGTVSVLWAFAESPKETFTILCHVISHCTYDLILGNRFLTETKTLTDFCHRLAKCAFPVVNMIPCFGFLGEKYQRMQGTLGDEHSVLAIPDTGADRNVMSLKYAVDHGFKLMTGQNHCGYLQFADGSYDKTVGQVKTYWTFASGERVPVTFEVLEYCCSDVVIGEEILMEHNVFVEHAASILLTMTGHDDSYELAPFDFINSWQRCYKKVKDKAASMGARGDAPAHNGLDIGNGHIQEQNRRDLWNYKYDFGNKATTVEQQLELARRERYESERVAMSSRPDPDTAASNAERQSRRRRMPIVPSIPTSQSRR